MLAILGELAAPRSIVMATVRPFLTVLQGVWWIQTAYIMYTSECGVGHFFFFEAHTSRGVKGGGVGGSRACGGSGQPTSCTYTSECGGGHFFLWRQILVEV